MSLPFIFVKPTTNCDRVRCRAGWRYTHEESERLTDQELWVIWAGRGTLHTNGADFELRSGSCVWMRPGTIYEASQVEADPLGLTSIHFQFQKRHLNLGHQYPEFFDVWDLNYIDAVTRRIVEIMRQGTADEEQQRTAGLLLSGVLLDLIKSFRDTEKKSTNPIARHHNATVRRTVQHIYDSVEAPLSVADLARKAGYSPAHFSTLFKRITGQTAESMIVQARLEKASRLLRWSNLSIGQVAQAAGYPDVYFFSRQFKLKTGLTPTNYRLAGHEDRLELLTIHHEALIDRQSPGAEDVKHGFEGGRVVKVGHEYHLFTVEMAGDPKNVKTRLAHWRSKEGLRWTRRGTLFESSGKFDGSDPRAALWSPIPIYDDDEQRWNLFYVAYRAAENTVKAWHNNYDGRIWRAVSQTPGREGIDGPYMDKAVVLAPGPESQSWEGLQGVDSFFPYKVGDEWRAFYGSAHTERVPCEWWGVGLANSKRLAGPWKRLPEGNPIQLDEVFVESPVVTPIEGGGYLVLFNGGHRGEIGYSFSADGLHWPRADFLLEKEMMPTWLKIMRTPLGVILEEDGRMKIFFTAYDGSFYGIVGLLQVRLVKVPASH
jgi:AraC-like DNA-binding protein